VSKPILMGDVIHEQLIKIAKLEQRIESLEQELAFTKAYLNPVDTSFKTMVDDFMSLPNDKKDKLIDLEISLAALAQDDELKERDK